MLRIRPVLLVAGALVLALGTGGLVGATTAGARAAVTTLCRYQVAQVDGGRFIVQNNEWGSSASECVTTDGSAGFLVANSGISDPTNGAPGGYPSIFMGCHWGDCTPGAGLGTDPLRLTDLGPGTVTSNWYTTQPNGSYNDYDVAYDIWINRTATASGAPDGTEIMIWINDHGPVQPAGSLIATNARIGTHHYDVWHNPGGAGADSVSYEMMHPHTGVTNLDISGVINDAVRRGYTERSWYLISVEAGFEIWQGGAGLATKSFSVNLKAPLAPLTGSGQRTPTVRSVAPLARGGSVGGGGRSHGPVRDDRTCDFAGFRACSCPVRRGSGR